ncbi:MAG: MarR family transcriptional regulator [Propionibacteriaceae bacterium]|jgi:DNA-binding MarR family transcriptional regulator|nr:MarR family transcriptional regulator [Propionibacteriaceae bacterium]
MEDDVKQAADLAQVVLSLSRQLKHATDERYSGDRLSGIEASVMSLVETEPGISTTRIARTLDMKCSNVSAVLRALEAREFLAREPDESDGRKIRVYPLPASAKNLDKLREFWGELLADACGDPKQLAAAAKVLQGVSGSLRGSTAS